MTRDSIRDKLDAYVDESLPLQDRTAVEEHAQSCSTCAGEILARAQMKRATRLAAENFAQSTAFRMRPEFRRQIEKKMLKSRVPLWKTPFAWLAAGAIAMVLILAPLLLHRESGRKQEIAELLDVHIATLASTNPVDVVSSDRHTVKPWFQGKLPFTFNLPELQDSPYKLLGGKLVYLEQKPAAQLIFELHKHQLSVFITQESAEFNATGSALVSGNVRGFSTEIWTQAGLRYVVIGDAGAADVHTLGDLLRAAAK